MVLAELGQSITSALAKAATSRTLDQSILDEILKEIATALLQADVNVKLVAQLRNNVKRKVNMDDMAGGLNKQRVIEQAVFSELCAILDPGTKKLEPKKGKTNVVMFVGLQGAGKTTTCTKYAYFYKKKGFKPALVCADTFRAGAFDQLKQNATKAQIPYYGSFQETDPSIIAANGVSRFREEKRDLIIVDTSGRHRQEESLIEEMRQVATAVRPDIVIFVMDGSIGQAAYDQAKAFHDSVDVGSVIITKLDGHAKGGGALSAVVATRSPIAFIGTGEHMHEFQDFETERFVASLMGRGDLGGFISKIRDVIPPEEQQQELMDKLTKGQFSLRIMYDQFASMMRMGPMSSIMGMLPGMANMFPASSDKESQARMKKMMTIMDSMTDKELDETTAKMIGEQSRVERWARGSGSSVEEVLLLLGEYKKLGDMFTKTMKNVKLPKGGGAKGDPRNMQQMMQKMMSPDMMKMVGGPGGMQALMKQLGGAGMKL
jgi:signal recognition particle subunit SRP54